MTGERHNEQPLKSSAVGRAIGVASELGITMGLLSAAMLLGCLALGRWLDRSLSTSPLLTIVLLLAGALASQIALYRMATGAAAQLNEGARHVLNRKSLQRSLGLAAQVLLLAALPALLGAVAGLLLDRVLGTVGVLLVVLTVVGFALSIVLLLKLMRAHSNASHGDS